MNCLPLFLHRGA